MTKFDGRKIRDDILGDLKNQIVDFSVKPTLAVIWNGTNFISKKYINSKRKVANELNVNFELFELKKQQEIIDKILELNAEDKITGIMVQLPLTKEIDRRKVIAAISPDKDIDGLRYCTGLDSKFFPPVTLAILEAIKNSGARLVESKVAIVGQGFLVGDPISRILKGQVADLRLVDRNVKNLSELTIDADIIISATGCAEMISSIIVKKGVILIDAGTTEVGGELKGDIDSSCYKKAIFYTPVPGGIGPVTVAMLFKNLIEKLK